MCRDKRVTETKATMKIRSLNNATIYVKTSDYSLLIDPWLIGDLYKGAWSPYSRTTDLNFLAQIDCVFISHIHEDHWDLNTLDKVSKSAKIILPNLIVNRVIEKRLKSIGFNQIEFAELGENIALNNSLTIRTIPPLNAFAQDLGMYEQGYEYDATNIDTSVLLTDEQSDSSHLFLCDNSPYDLNRLGLGDINLTTIWYPFNSYAMDYPVCYENITKSERAKIHDEMHKKRIESTVAAIAKLRPKYCFPHSADFVLNGPVSDEFGEYVREDFMDRKKVAKKYGLLLTNIATQSEYLDAGDIMVVSNGDISIQRNKFSYSKVQPIRDIPDLKTEIIENLESSLIDSFDRMLERVERFEINLESVKDWVLVLNTGSLNMGFCFKERKIYTNMKMELAGRKVLQVNLTDKQLSALLKREFHWNNAMIGCHLKFKRIPNEFCQPVYKALNFLHL